MIPGVSATYPYRRIYNFFQFGEADTIPHKVLRYLLDLPSAGYTPPDDNDYPRTRLKKLLYWDDPKPLSKPLPTAEQIRSVFFDPSTPDAPPDKEKGYRIFPQALVTQAQTQGKTILRCYMGPVYPYSQNHMSSFEAQVTVCFEVMSNTSYEANVGTDAMSRTYSIMCAAIDALNGVNIDGVGSFYFDRTQNTYCGATPISDESTNIGYRFYVGVTLAGGNEDIYPGVNDYDVSEDHGRWHTPPANPYKPGKGVTDYEQLENLPGINGVTVIGHKKGLDYKLQDKMFEVQPQEIDQIIFGG